MQTCLVLLYTMAKRLIVDSAHGGLRSFRQTLFSIVCEQIGATVSSMRRLLESLREDHSTRRFLQLLHRRRSHALAVCPVGFRMTQDIRPAQLLGFRRLLELQVHVLRVVVIRLDETAHLVIYNLSPLLNLLPHLRVLLVALHAIRK